MEQTDSEILHLDMWMLVGVVLRPMLMAIGMVVSLSAFNNIMQIVNAIFAPAVAGMTDPSDNSLLTLGVYIAIYTSLAYTLANSAFKLIDMLPNWVMTWIGARLEQRADDASAIQQMSQGYVQNLAFSNRADQVDLGGKNRAAASLHSKVQAAEDKVKAGQYGIPIDSSGGTGAGGATPPAGGGNSKQSAHSPRTDKPSTNPT